MDFYGLTEPVKVNKYDNIISQIEEIYHYFCKAFIDNENNRHLQNDFIFVKNNFISGMHERFLHSVSMEDKEFYNIYPCNNDRTYVDCYTRCKISESPDIFKKINRALCFYRLSRVHWVPEVISYTNAENPNIKVWRKEEKDLTNGKWRWKRYVRYENGLADYVIIFNEIYKNGDLYLLDFRTAYPVFVKPDKIRFSKEYNKYISKIKK